MSMFEAAVGSVMPPFAQAMGVTLESMKTRECIIRVPYMEHMVGDPDTGVIHGGVITAILDNASGWAVRCHEDWLDGVSMATLDLRIDYMKPAEPNVDLLVEANCYKLTKTIAFVRGVAYHEDAGDPVATSVAAFMLGTPNTPGKNL